MKIDSLNNETVRKYIPNVFADIEGETPLYEKLLPWINSAKSWLEAEFLGPEFEPERHSENCLFIVVNKALADAVPSLDLVLTPNGFGVVSTESVAPASKERIERLAQGLQLRVSNELEFLLECLYHFDEWRNSERGRYYTASFMQKYSDWNRTKCDSFDVMRGEAMRIEKILADKYLGHNLMDAVREKYSRREPWASVPISAEIRNAVKDIMDGVRFKNDQNAYWHAARPVILEIKRRPEYRAMWEDEMAHLFKSDFENTRPGAIFF